MPTRDRYYDRTFITQATHRRRTDGDPSIFLDYANIGNGYTPGRNHTQFKVQVHFDATCPIGMTIYDGVNNLVNNGSTYLYNVVNIQDQYLASQNHAPIASEYAAVTSVFNPFAAFTLVHHGVEGPGLTADDSATTDAVHFNVAFSPITLEQNLDLTVPQDIQRNPDQLIYPCIITVTGRLRDVNLRLINLDLVSLDTNNAESFLRRWTESDFLSNTSKIGTSDSVTASDYKSLNFTAGVPLDGGNLAFRATVRDYAANPPINYINLIPAYTAFNGVAPAGEVHGTGTVGPLGPTKFNVSNIAQTGNIVFKLLSNFL